MILLIFILTPAYYQEECQGGEQGTHPSAHARESETILLRLGDPPEKHGKTLSFNKRWKERGKEGEEGKKRVEGEKTERGVVLGMDIHYQ